MKRLMLGMAAVMMACAAWTQAPAQGTTANPPHCPLTPAGGLGTGAVSR